MSSDTPSLHLGHCDSPCECGFGTTDAAGYIDLHALDCPKNPLSEAYQRQLEWQRDAEGADANDV